jgi:hypothetical protein
MENFRVKDWPLGSRFGNKIHFFREIRGWHFGGGIWHGRAIGRLENGVYFLQ